jgi:hypothetical protein
MNSQCRCVVADSLAFAAYNFKYWIDIQKRGSITQLHDKRTDVRDTPLYKISSTIFAPAQLALEDSQGAVCPHIMLLRAIASGWPSSKSTSVMGFEVVNILREAGVVESDNLPEMVQAVMERLQGCISGRFIPDWMEAVKSGNDFVE